MTPDTIGIDYGSGDETVAAIMIDGVTTFWTPLERGKRTMPEIEKINLGGMVIKAFHRVVELEVAQTQWVKCSERLPEKPGSYITKMHWLFTTEEYTTAIAFFYGDRHESGMRGFSSDPGGKVVAWLEGLPEFMP